jgi:hypothetical protein
VDANGAPNFGDDNLGFETYGLCQLLMWFFGDTLKGSKVLGGESRLLVHWNLAVPSPLKFGCS